jgi:hypothetical protein
MRTLTRIAIASAALTAGLALTGGSQAHAGIAISTAFHAPRAGVSIRIGHPQFRAGAYIPRGYRIHFRPSYGYGFTYRDCWIPVRRYHSTWRVCDRPYVAYGGYGRYDDRDRYDDRYERRRGDRYDRRDHDRDRYGDRDGRDRWND